MASTAAHRRDSLPVRSDAVVLTLWTDDPGLAAEADAAGVDRIGVDLERSGKSERQRGLGTWVSPHRVADLARLRLRRARLFARVDPRQPEVETLLDVGAQVLMLPMVASAAEAETFVDAVAGRARVVLLVERAEALVALPDLVRVAGVDEVHLGINDLALSLGLRNRWQVLAGEIPWRAGRLVTGAGLRFGLAGIGRAHDASLPIPADLVYAELARTGASAALLARSFLGGDLAADVTRARSRLAEWSAAGAGARSAAHAELGRRATTAPAF